MDNDYIIQLITKLDGSKTADDLKKIEQQLNAKGINLKTSLDTATSKQELQELAKQLQSVLKAAGLDIDTSKIMSAFNQVTSEAQKVANQVNKIQFSMSTGEYDSKVQSLIAKTNQWVDANGNARISTESLQTAMTHLNTAYANVTASGGNTITNQQSLIEAERLLEIEIKKVSSSVTSMNAQFAKSSAVDSLRQKIQYFYDANSASHKKWGAQMQGIMTQLASGTQVPIVKLKELEAEFIAIQNAARQAGKLGNSFGQTLKAALSSFSYWTSATYIVMQSVYAIRNAITNVKELDDSLLELTKVSDLTADGLAKVTDEAYKLGERVGRTGKQVIDAVTEFKRAGYELNDSINMAEAALVMTNVAEGINDTADAAGTLISVLKGYNMAESEVMSIVDMMNSTSNQSPIGFDELAEGLERTAGTMAQSGTTIQETIGLITAGYAQLRNVERVSTSLITLSARLRGVNEDGEEIDGLSAELEESFGKIGVAIEDADGNLRSIYKIAQDYAKVLPTLTSEQKQYYAELAAGCLMNNKDSSNVQKCA